MRLGNTSIDSDGLVTGVSYDPTGGIGEREETEETGSGRKFRDKIKIVAVYRKTLTRTGHSRPKEKFQRSA